MVVAVPPALVIVGPAAKVVVPEGASQTVLVASPVLRIGIDDRPAADERAGRQGVVRQGEVALRDDVPEGVLQAGVHGDAVRRRRPDIVGGDEDVLDRAVRQVLVGDLVDRAVGLRDAQVVLAPEVVGVDEPGDVLVDAQDVVAEGDVRRALVRVEPVLVTGRNALEVVVGDRGSRLAAQRVDGSRVAEALHRVDDVVVADGVVLRRRGRPVRARSSPTTRRSSTIPSRA